MVKAKREETAAAVEGVVEAAVPVLVLEPVTVEREIPVAVEGRAEVTGSELALMTCG